LFAGSCCIVKEGQLAEKIESKAYIGLSSTITARASNGDVVCTSECEVLEIEHAYIRSLREWLRISNQIL